MINDQIVARLYVFIRENIKGGCKKFSLGDKCECPLCDLDRLLDASNQGASMSQHTELIARLRNTPNWQRESYGDWKNGTLFYDRAPFEAADALEAAAALQALERVPMTDQEFTAWIESSGFVIEPHTAWTIKELVERHHGITPPENKG